MQVTVRFVFFFSDGSDSDSGLIAQSNTQSLPHTAWPSNVEANEMCSLGAGDMAVGSATERNGLILLLSYTENSRLQSRLRRGPLRFGGGSFDTEDKDLCCSIVISKWMWHAISPGVSTNCGFIELYVPCFAPGVQQGGNVWDLNWQR